MTPRSQCVAALLCLMLPTAAGAVHPEEWPIPYFGASTGLLLTDAVRASDDGAGLQVVFGVPLEDPRNAVELRFADYGFTRAADGKDDFQTALFIDYVRDFGPMGDGGSMLARTQPFLIAGAGFVKENVRSESHLHFGANLGGGLLMPLGFKGWGLRLDARVQAQGNNESCDAEAATQGFCTGEATSLVDWQVGLGVQIPMAWFYERPVKLAPVEDCPVAVVDPVTGRRDCVADSDKDGVPDEADQCPGSVPGARVDAQGCARLQVSNDLDADGVANAADACPETPTGFRVDASGCVVPQVSTLAGVTFEPNSARLTVQGRTTLDGVARMLQRQVDLRGEIAGHTDDVGSQTYNLLLSQRRAEAVRDHLIAAGVEAGRLAAVGYGEAEPLATNATEAGRAANRRVEFRLGSGPDGE